MNSVGQIILNVVVCMLVTFIIEYFRTKRLISDNIADLILFPETEKYAILFTKDIHKIPLSGYAIVRLKDGEKNMSLNDDVKQNSKEE